MTVYTDLTARALTVLRRSLPKHQWDQFAEKVVRYRQGIEGHLREESPPGHFDGVAANLRDRSHVQVPITLSNVDELRQYFDDQPVHKGANALSFDGRAKSLTAARQDFPLAAYSAESVIRAPALIDTMNDPRLLHLIEAYLGCVPTLYSVNAWWSFVAPRPEMTNVQYFHRDTDDWRFVTLFIDLTDVAADGGPHEVVPESHSLDGMKKLIADLHGIHLSGTRKINVADAGEARRNEVMKLNPPIAQPVVRVHPETGRKAIYLGEKVKRFDGMTEEESKPLIDYLNRHSTKAEFVFRQQWRENDLLIWDNRCTLHQALGDFDESQLRHMERTTVLGTPSGYVAAA